MPSTLTLVSCLLSSNLKHYLQKEITYDPLSYEELITDSFVQAVPETSRLQD